MYFFSGNTLFNDRNVWEDRGFNSLEEMNSTIIEKYNSRVTDIDTTFILGNYGFGDIETIRRQMKGEIVLITGRYDRINETNKDLFEKVSSFYRANLDISGHRYRITLCHWPLASWPNEDIGAWHLYCQDKSYTNIGKSFNVNIDNNNLYPYSFGEIMDAIERK